MPVNNDYLLIPEPLRDIYRELEHELVWIRGRWQMYVGLFGTNEKRIDLLNETAPEFFAAIETDWFHHVILEICKLTDPPKSLGRDNLVIRLLIENTEDTYPSLAGKLKVIDEKEVDLACRALRVVRNKHIAHRDKAFALGSSPLPGVSLDDLDKALTAIGNYMDAFRVEFMGGGNMYFGHIYGSSDAKDLIYALKQAVEYTTLESEDPQFSIRLQNGAYGDA
jgi:hypothetical protein